MLYFLSTAPLQKNLADFEPCSSVVVCDGIFAALDEIS